MAANTERTRSALQLGMSGTRGRFAGEFHRLLASRLRVICLFGATIIPGFFLIDLIVWRWMAPDLPLPLFGFVRIIAAVYYFLLWVLLASSDLSNRALSLIDLTMFPPTCVLASFLGVYATGIDTIYYAGVVLVIFSRAVLIPGSVPRTLGVILACWLTYPLTVFVSGWFMPAVAVQWDRAERVAGFVSNNTFLLFSSVLAAIGAWVVNRLQLQEYRLQRIGRYVIQRKLGEGGMGVVYLAKHGVLKRTLAIKLLGSKHPINAAMRLRFEREAKHTSQLSHPNTIQIFDFGVSEDGLLFYAMEYVEGFDLRRLVDRFGTLPAGRAIHLVGQACRSIHHAHEHGIVHRDVKPENCMVGGLASEPDFLKVLDFGLAKVTRGDAEDERLSRTGAVMGTPHYMAPELCTGQPVDGRTDVYSLGCVLFYVLTGQPTFRGDSWMEVMMLHTSEPPAPPSSLNPGVPGDLDAVVLRALAKDPRDRFRSAAEMDDALQQCAAAGSWALRDAADWWQAHQEEAAFAFEPPGPADKSGVAPFATTIEFSIGPDSFDDSMLAALSGKRTGE